MTALPPEIKTVLRRIASDGSALLLGGNSTRWFRLDDWEDVRRVSGIYALGLTLGVQYDLGVSRVIYIGATRNLRTRIQSHASGSHNCRIELLKQRYPAGLLAMTVAIPDLEVDWLRALEANALEAAKQTLGRYPICNMDPVESKLLAQSRQIIKVELCRGLQFPLNLDVLRKQLGEKSLGKLREWKETDPTARPTPDENAVRLEAALEVNRVGILSNIMQEHVATWSSEKMQAIADVCRRLTRKKMRTKSTVQTFEASFRAPPLPHTWGEVALVQGRIVARGWYPAQRTWVKVVTGKELLGQAILDDRFYRGEDVSDRPQTEIRCSVWDDPTWIEEFETIQGQLPPGFTPQQRDITAIPDVEPIDALSADHLRLLQGSRDFDMQAAKESAERDRQGAIVNNQYAKARALLQQRIESKYCAQNGRTT